ncbi:MAG: adenine methyltransferase [Verrucomicrobiales bacterium]|nr:adenine methyltransferase [Verrucomicrobiales bacterium]
MKRSRTSIPGQLGLDAIGESTVSRHAVHFSSRSEEWSTPQGLFDTLDAEFGFTLDPCATHQNAKCERHFTRAEDGLRQDWGQEVVFMNPPYGRGIAPFMAKAYESAQAGATVVCLVPARTDTRWWHRYAMKGEIRLMRGRLKFGGCRNSAPFPSAIVVFRPRAYRLKAWEPSRPDGDSHRQN